MSRFARFIKGLTSPVTSGGDDTLTEREKRHEERSARRRRYNSPDVAEKDDGVNRRATASEGVQDAALKGGAQTKPYDPVFLRDISANAIVQAYIDTLSQDVAGANWNIKPRDEDADIAEEDLAQIERDIKDLPPQKSFRDVLESTTRVLLELGDATWVKHYDGSKDLAELVAVDSASFFKQVDSHGITEGYVQVSRKSKQVKAEFNTREVVWFEWSSRPDRHYGQGPLEKAQNEVELIEELAEKERLDLMQGSPPGVISPEISDEFGGLPNGQDWDTFVEKFRLNEGERHRVGYSKTPVNFTPIQPNYQELQILDRSKYWVTVLGSVFKVNPSYAGFDFENVNRATDESQQEAYSQRGFRITLRQLEESINRGLVWSEYSEDVKFEFEREQTVEQQKTRAELIETQAKAGKEMENAGRSVHYRDGSLVVDDGEMSEGNAGSSGGGGGGFFGSVDAEAEAKEGLSKAQIEKLDKHILDAYKSQIWPESVDSIEKGAWEGGDIPEYVFEQIREVIDQGAVFESFDSLPGRVQNKVEDILGDALTDPEGWSLDSIVDKLDNAFPGVDKDNLEVVARTESASVLNEAREEGYRERDLDDALFKWQGPSDSRTTEACEQLKDMTNPDYGGEPRPLPELIELQRQVHSEHFDNLQFRKHTIHPNERHTFVRHRDTGVDVDVPSAEDMQERFEENPEDMPVPPRDEG